ncbi:hypothetical protein RHECNPAF_930019 [Rhizobium etli CNPAF512]|nr:hypothetical protein RHECNPAF_930019 [Rhizobium etli CNPAF512]
MNSGEFTDGTAVDETAQAPDAGDEATVLDDGVDAAGFGGKVD